MQNDESRLVTIPNLLTLVRILLVPVFAIAIYAYQEKRYISLGIFTLASLTDGIDGYLARKLKQISSFGKLVDPLADKLMIVCMIYCLMHEGLLAPAGYESLSKWVFLLILVKEIFMVAGGMFMLSRGIVVHSSIFGKIATALFCLAIILIFPAHGIEPWHGVIWLQNVGRFLTIIATCASFVALFTYIKGSLVQLKLNKNESGK